VADPALAFCGQADAALARVAARVALHETSGQGTLDDSELAFAMLAEGEPHVWPHAFTVSAPKLENDDVAARLRRFLGTLAGGGVRRCGVARASASDGTETVAVVVVDALADLATLPTLGHVGQWMRFDATMLVPSAGATLVVLAPTGTPRTVSPAVHGDFVRATFALTEPGPFTVQLVAVPSGGPRPVLEAMLFADTPPPREFAAWPAPGEDDARPDDPVALFAMVNAARASESVPPLVRSDALDRVAASEAAALRRLGRLAHDAGDGDPVERVRRAGLEPKLIGENVAHAATLRLAHRLLWESPSHRGNLLDPRFDTLGVGLAPGTDSRVWVCEIFANFAVAGIGAVRGRP
jgi:uncharacterized protein YkwD